MRPKHRAGPRTFLANADIPLVIARLLDMCTVRLIDSLQGLVEDFQVRESGKLPDTKVSDPKGELIPTFLNGRQLRDYQVRQCAPCCIPSFAS